MIMTDKKSVGRIFNQDEKVCDHIPLTCGGAGFITNYPTFRIDRLTYPAYCVMHVIKGILHVEHLSARHMIKKGNLVLISLFDKHKYWADSEEPCDLLWFQFSGRVSAEIFKLATDVAGTITDLPDETVANMMAHIVELSINGGQMAFFRTSELAYMVLLKIIEYGTRSMVPGLRPEAEEMVNKINKYIDAHIKEHITLDILSKIAKFSIYHFSRLFQLYTGKSPMAYVLARKIEKAKYEILYTSKSLGCISEELGFADQSHFWRSFKKIEGYSPRKLRNT